MQFPWRTKYFAKRSLLALTIAFASCWISWAASDSGLTIDAKLPSYVKQSADVAGEIKSIGSDTMANLMLVWTDSFKQYYPDVKASIESKGSSTAPPALINGTANFGPMSRQWKASESDDFEKKYGYPPTVLSTSIDVLAVYVNKDCPLDSLTLEQVDAIFSSTRKGGATKDITTWGDLGLTGNWADKPIRLFGRNSASGTYQYFKEHALFGGDFKAEVNQAPTSAAVVNGIAKDQYGLGYSGIGYKTADVKALTLDNGAGPIAAAAENAYNSKYPLARPLLISWNDQPGSKLDPLRREFIRFLYSKEGQQLVVKDGYLPLPIKSITNQLTKVGLTSDSSSADNKSTK
jgi:phosphate transport system substrate-binding protein